MSCAGLEWNECLRNPQALRSIYGEDALPDLSRVQLHDVLLDERRNMRISFSSVHLPKVLPRRWPASSNRVHITLVLWDISSVTMEGWNTDQPGKIDVMQEADLRMLRFDSHSCRFSALFVELGITEINGFETTATWPWPE